MAYRQPPGRNGAIRGDGGGQPYPDAGRAGHVLGGKGASLDSCGHFEFDRAGADGDQFFGSRQVVLTTLRPLSLSTLPTSSRAPGATPRSIASEAPPVPAIVEATWVPWPT